MTLVCWYKDTVPMEEIKTLLQGLQLPAPPIAKATELLPPARVQPSSLPHVAMEPYSFLDPVDTTGQAKVRNRGSSSPLSSTFTSSGTLPVAAAHSQPSASKDFPDNRMAQMKSRSGRMQASKQGPKTYSCSVCNKPMTSGGHAISGATLLS